MNAELNTYVVHMVPLVHACSPVPPDRSNTGLAVWVHQPRQSVGPTAVPLRPLQHMS